MTELLSLSTIVKAKDTVMIESKLHPKGRSYDLIGLDDLGPFEYQKILDRTAAADKLGVIEKPTAAQARELGKALADILKIVAPSIEPSVVTRLNNSQRAMIVATWTVSLTTERTASGSGEGNARSRRTTGGSSRNSKGSTAASRKRGSTSRRG